MGLSNPERRKAGLMLCSIPDTRSPTGMEPAKSALGSGLWALGLALD